MSPMVEDVKCPSFPTQFASIWCGCVQFGTYLMHAAKETSVDALVAAVFSIIEWHFHFKRRTNNGTRLLLKTAVHRISST